MEGLYQYPRGFGGTALLLLRLSVGLLLFSHVGRLSTFNVPAFVTVFAYGVCLGLGLGILTPILSAVVILGVGILMLFVPGAITIVSIVTLLLCTAVCLLGAGGYSLDGILFGQRRVVL